MKSFERDIDSATGFLDLRNALALGFTSLVLPMIVVKYHELYSAYSANATLK